jgi:serine/threonine-protein kinase
MSISSNLVIKGYKIEKLIREGGFAGVYLATKVLSKESVAIKILTPQANQSSRFRSSVYKESNILSKLNHKNIVNCYGMIEKAPRTAMEIEYFNSQTLRYHIMNKSDFFEKYAVGIFRQICQALKHVHESSIVHRDIKPENILVNDNGEVRLIDFAISEKMGLFSIFTKYKRDGTPYYMSPEQIRCTKQDQRSDIYSLGATFYHVFSGQTHITAGSEAEILKHQLKMTTPKIRSFDKTFPHQLDNILQRMLEKKPENRYENMAEILFDLGRYTKNDHIQRASA